MQTSQKPEPVWSMEEDSPDQPSAVYSTAQPVSDNASGSLLSLNTSHVCPHCPAAFELIDNLELHLASVHGDKLCMVLPGCSTPDRCDAGNSNNTDTDKEKDGLKNSKIQESQYVCGVSEASVRQGRGRPRKDRQYACDSHSDSKVEEKVTDTETCLRRGRSRTRKRVRDVCESHSENKTVEKNDSEILSVRKGSGKKKDRQYRFMCGVCCEDFYHFTVLKKHMLRHYPQERTMPLNICYVCQRCSAAFVLVSSLEHHLASVHGEELDMVLPWSCKHDIEKEADCHRNRNVPKKAVLVTNLKRGTGCSQKAERQCRFMCGICYADFDLFSTLKNHMPKHYPEKRVKASDLLNRPMSGNTSGSLLSLNVRFVCLSCSAHFVLVSSLELHLASVHGQKLNFVLPVTSTPKKCKKSDAGECSDSDWDPGIRNECSDSDFEPDSPRKRQARKRKKKTDVEANSHSRSKIPEKKVYFNEVCVKKGVGKPKKERQYQCMCGICYKLFDRHSLLKIHMEKRHPPQEGEKSSDVLDQPMSDTTFGSLPSLNTTYVCQRCSAPFVLVSSLELHLASVHGQKLYQFVPGYSAPTKEKYVCDVCNEAFDWPAHLIRHRPKHFRQRKEKRKKYLCEACGKPFWTPSDLMKHERTHTGAKPFVCGICKMRFSQKSGLNSHKKKCHGEGTFTNPKPFMCDVCGKTFIQKCGLMTHKKLKHFHPPRAPKLFVCGFCGKKLSSRNNLMEHKKIHSGEKPFKCTQCKRDFRHLPSLQNHIKAVHTNERPHVCDFCGKGFVTAGTLKTHRDTHTGETKKPFVCSFCGKAFISCAKLEMHHHTHTGERPFVCADCGKAFAQKSTLQGHHLMVHTDQRPHSCPQCSAAFKMKNHLRTHIKLKHKNTVQLQGSQQHSGPHQTSSS